MEFLIVVMILLVAALVVGATVYLSRELRVAHRGEDGSPVASIDVLRVELDARHQADLERLRVDAKRAFDEIEAELVRLRDGVRSTHQEHDSQMNRLRDRFVEVDGKTLVQLDRAVVDLRSNQDAAIERLREAVGAALTAFATRGSGPNHASERRASSLSDLYRRFATLEAGFISITNPGLLPGESFSLPVEFTEESLIWETWKGFGDSVFSFAEAFNEERIHVDDQTCRDIVSFLSDVRHTLTKSVFPNLPESTDQPDGDGLPGLRGAIMHLGTELSSTRARIERAYRDEEG